MSTIENARITLQKGYSATKSLFIWLYRSLFLLPIIYVAFSANYWHSAPWDLIVAVWLGSIPFYIGLKYICKAFKHCLEKFYPKTYGYPSVLLKVNSPECDRTLWRKLPPYRRLKLLKRVTKDGSPQCWCKSVDIRDWGLSSKGDHERAHICARCNYAIYRSER